MLITAVRSRAVSLPLQPVPYSVERAGTKREWGKTRLTPHRPKPSLQYVIVEIDTDDGITGVGEACTDIGFFGEPVEEVQSAIDLYLGPTLLGKDPFDREQLLFDIDFPGNSCAKSGIDLALHDLLGKALGVPVCNLIGGSGRRQVLAVMEVTPGTADGMARQCAEWVEQGVRGFKAKVGAIPERRRGAAGGDSRGGGPGDHAARGRQPGLHAEGGDPAVPHVRAPRPGAGIAGAAGPPSGTSPAWPKCGPRWTC